MILKSHPFWHFLLVFDLDASLAFANFWRYDSLWFSGKSNISFAHLYQLPSECVMTFEKQNNFPCQSLTRDNDSVYLTSDINQNFYCFFIC